MTTQPSPPKKYRTVCVDPPWEFYLRSPKAYPKYELMTLDQIAALPVGEWADVDAHLYLWTTNAHMEEAHQIARSWGFTKKTILTWCKEGFGLGYYYRNSTEHVLFCVKGKLATLRNDVPTHFRGRERNHSEKPAAFYDMVESMSPGPYLDVFARKLRFNWDAWGLEVGAPDGLPTPQEVAAATREEGT